MAGESLNVLHLLRRSHEERVVTALRTHGASSRADLGRRTKLSRATLSAIIRDLLARDVLVEIPAEDGRPRGRGRPATLLALNPKGGLALGLDLGHRRIHVAIANVAHEIAGSASAPCTETTPWARRLAIALRLVDELTERLRVSLASLGGVGVGVVGPVLEASGRPQSRRVGRVNLIRGGLGERFGVPVYIDNNTRLAALAEAIWGAGVGVENVLYIQLSYGVGGGLVLGGHLYSGGAGAAGEFGHISVDVAGPDCPCGGRGCLERYVSLGAVLEQCHSRSLDQVLRRLAGGDQRVRDVIETAGWRIGRVVAASCNVVNPDVVVVGGELAAAGDHLMNPLSAAVRTYAHRGVQHGLRIRPAALRQEGAARGGIALVLREWALLAGYPAGAGPSAAVHGEDYEQAPAGQG